MTLAVLNRAQVRRVDQIASDRYAVPGIVLMENAGRGVVETLWEEGVRGPVVVVCGKGNNAGDGFVIARHLAVRRVPCEVLLACSPQELRGDAAINFEVLRRLELPWREVVSPASAESFAALLNEADWIIDALLGTGTQGKPAPLYATLIRAMNAAAGRRVAVDIPSGLDCDTGIPSEPTFQADVTCTFVALKPGFLQPAAKPYVGEVRVIDIGVPERVIAEAVAAEATARSSE